MAKLNLDVVQNFPWYPDLYGNLQLPKEERMWLLLKDWPAKEQQRLLTVLGSDDIDKVAGASKEIDDLVNASVLEIHNATCNGPDGIEVPITDVVTLRAKLGVRFTKALVQALLYPMTGDELKKLQARFSG